MIEGTRGGLWLRALLALLAIALVGVGSASARPTTNCIQAGEMEHCTYGPAGAEQTLAVPAGVSQVTIAAIGAPGLTPDPNYGGQGGLGGTANAQVSVTPGSTLYIEVGSGGTFGQGGWNGGGGGESGGGGASDVRTVSCTSSCAAGGSAGSLASRLIVAGGGGGGGYPGAFSGIQLAGNHGGGAGFPGVSYGPGVSEPVDGGEPGTLSAGGAGGPGENGGGAGQAGTLGLGGAGTGVAGPGGGGGGGGGYYGGGGGGNGGTAPNGALSPGDGGGGGSSYAPDGITGLAAPGTPPAVSINYELPQPPSITSGDNATFTVGQSNTFTVTTMHTPALSEAGTLPDGVSFTDNGDGTATLSGTPASDAVGTYPLTINASNGVAPAASQSFTLTVVENPPAIVGAYPVITGDTSGAGQTLTVSDGDWSSFDPPLAYQWSQCAADGSDCVPIDGATLNEYVTQAADLGHEIEASVTATNSGGSVTVSDTTNAVIGAPTSVTLPQLSGDYSDVGGTLSVTDGTWTGSPTSITYQWITCTDNSGSDCASIPGATSNDYVIANGDIGQYLQVEVTASNDYGSWSVWVYELSQIGSPANVALPTIGGTAAVGQLLTGTRGTWDGSPTHYTYQWMRCDETGNNCNPLPSGGGGLSYTVHTADAGHTLEIAVTASNATGSTTATSNPTAVVAAPANTSPPGITGTAAIGDVLTGSRGTWTRATSYAYQWERCDSSGSNCAPIAPGGLGSNYTVKSTDAGHTLVFQVTGSNATGSTPASSSPTGVVQGPSPVNNSLPAISPTASVVVGTALTGTRGTWTNVTSFTYEWLRCSPDMTSCTAIGLGGLGLKYTVHQTDAGYRLDLAVVATNAYNQTTAYSIPTNVVPGSPPANNPSFPPAITGTAALGSPLTGSRGTWTNATSYAYQWLRCDNAGNNCNPIPAGGRGLVYSPHAPDVGHELRLQVTATNAFGSTQVTSDPTAVVSP